MVEPIMCGRPLNCAYCAHAYYGLLHMVNKAQDIGYDIIDLPASECVRDNIYDQIDQHNPIFYFGVGHGNATVFTDDSSQPVWEVGGANNPINLEDRLVYLWSCLTGQQLGPHIINSCNAWAYAGFTEVWGWVCQEFPGGDPYEDFFARGFWEAGNEFISAQLDGMNFGDAFQASKDKYTEWIDYWYELGHPYSTAIIKWLVHDRDHFIMLGDPWAGITPPHDCNSFTNYEDCLSFPRCRWWNDSCHVGTICAEINNQPDCERNECFWYNNSCHPSPPTCVELDNRTECIQHRCYWWDNACHTDPKVDNAVDMDIPMMADGIAEMIDYICPDTVWAAYHFQVAMTVKNIGGHGKLWGRIFLHMPSNPNWAAFDAPIEPGETQWIEGLGWGTPPGATLDVYFVVGHYDSDGNKIEDGEIVHDVLIVPYGE